MAKPKGYRYSKHEREELLELYRQSGCSASRFSQQTGISYATLKRWLEPEPQQVNFVELSGCGAEGASGSLAVRLANGIECFLDGSIDKESAIGWIQALSRC